MDGRSCSGLCRRAGGRTAEMFARPRVFNSETVAAVHEAAVSVVAVSQDGVLTLTLHQHQVLLPLPQAAAVEF